MSFGLTIKQKLQTFGLVGLGGLVSWAHHGGANTSSLQDVRDPGTGSSEIVDDGEDQEAELALSVQELRLAHPKSFMVGLGEVRPWRSLTVAMGVPVGPDGFMGLDAGLGRQLRNGIYDKKTYDMNLAFQSVGVFGRIFFKKFENLSMEPSLSLTQWSGNISPFGVEPEDPANEALSGGYEANGVTLGWNMVSTWFLADHVSLDWTFIGLKKSWLTSHSNTRQSPWINGVIKRVITTPQVYGVTTVTFGYWF